ncbi:BF3164 family lipoprotein [Peijinzhouia sedimentorum]
MKIQLIFLLCIIIFSCNTNSNENPKNIVFPIEVDLVGKTILEDDITVNRLHSIDTLLLAELRGDSHLYAVYNPNDFTQLFKFAIEGSGPDEFIIPLYFTDFTIENENYMCWFYELNKYKLHKVNLSESLKEGELVIEDIIPLSQKANFSKVFYLDSTKLIGTITNMDIKMGRMRLYNPLEEEIIKTVENFPEVEKKSDDVNYLYFRHNYLYVGKPVIHPERNKIASLLNRFDRMDVFDTQLNLQNSISYSSFNENGVIDNYLTVENVNDSDIKSYYVDAFGTKDYIYALYQNQLFRDYGTEKPVEIRVFDWELNPVGLFRIPDYLANFTVDESRGKIYGVKSSSDNAILEYNFQKF